jgi:hypothetical protein
METQYRTKLKDAFVICLAEMYAYLDGTCMDDKHILLLPAAVRILLDKFGRGEESLFVLNLS